MPLIGEDILHPHAQKLSFSHFLSVFVRHSFCLSLHLPLSLPVFSVPRFLTYVDQTERIRVRIGSRNNDEYINHAKSESVCHVSRGDGIY